VSYLINKSFYYQQNCNVMLDYHFIVINLYGSNGSVRSDNLVFYTLNRSFSDKISIRTDKAIICKNVSICKFVMGNCVTLRELINAELIIAELIFADEGVKRSVFCGINFCRLNVLRRFCGIYFCGYKIKTIFFMLYMHIFFQIKLTIEK